jgi:predicted NACHT family NTPase
VLGMAGSGKTTFVQVINLICWLWYRDLFHLWQCKGREHTTSILILQS